MAKLPRLPKPGTFNPTPGLEAAVERVELPPEQLAARRAYVEAIKAAPATMPVVELDRRLVAPLSSSTRAAMMSREDRERFQRAFTSKEANANPPSFERRLSNSMVDAAKWGAVRLPVVAEAIEIADVSSQVYDAAASADPARELSLVAGRYAGGKIAGHYGHAIGAAGGAAAGALAGPGGATAGGFALGIAAGEAGSAAGSAIGERVAAAAVDYFRADQVQLPARDSLGRFRSSRYAAASVELDADDRDQVGYVDVGSIQTQRSRAVQSHELLGSRSYDDLLSTPAQPLAAPLGTVAVGQVQELLAGGGAKQARDLRQDLDAGARPGEVVDLLKQSVALQRETNQIMRNAGARPTTSATHAE